MLKNTLIALALVITGTLAGSFLVSAQSATELRNQIDNYNDRIEELDAEIRVYEQELLKIGADKQTLQNAINELNVARQKLSTDINKTESQISKTNLTIEQLAREIIDKEDRIDKSKIAMAGTLKELSDRENTSIIEMLLNQNNLADFWSEVSEINSLNESIQEAVENLEGLKFALQQQVAENEDQKAELEDFRTELANQRHAVDANKRDKDTLLIETENKEDNFQDILNQKRLARAEFESALRDFEAQLQYILDPDSLPDQGSLRWPLDTVRITQNFGLTPFALSGAYGYDGSGNPNPHRGIDFGVPSGTAIKASAAGTVRAIEDMDRFPGCYSYGQWILIDHENGLSTMYNHLSRGSSVVREGQSVNRGQVIAYSGNSGYSTGPHLDFRVFVRDAVEVQQFSNSIGCKQARVPIAPLNTYLNPMDYLPQS